MGLFRRIRQTAQQLGYRASEAFSGVVPPKVAFIHVPKTAGTSINSYFKDYVGSKQSGRCVYYHDFPGSLPQAFAEEAKRARFVTGHMPWNAFESFRDDQTFAFTFLRDPFDRLRSLYHHAANYPAEIRDDEDIRLVKGMSLEQFLVSNHPGIKHGTDNHLARQLAGAMDYFPQTSSERKQLAEIAIRNLLTLNLVGFVDSFDQDFSRIAEVAHLPRPPAGRKVNESSALAKTNAKREAARRLFDERLKKDTFPLVEADLLVYEHFLKLRQAEKAQAPLTASAPPGP
jgi:hypothetical protein